MLSFAFSQRGVSLVELMISMLLGFASLTAMASLVGHGIALNTKLIAKSMLDEEINAVMSIISRDIKRAGYRADTLDMVTEPSRYSSSFFASPITISAHASEAENSCITFAYDSNKNGVLDTITTNENYGYRLRDKALEMRVGGLACSSGYWHDLTNPDTLAVTTLSFTLETFTYQKISYKRVKILLQAELVAHPDLSRHAVRHVAIKNYE